MIAKGKSISHGTAALEYDLSKQIAGKDAATEVCRNGLYGTTGADMVQEMTSRGSEGLPSLPCGS